MRHPYEKFIQLELLAIICAVVFGFFAMIQSYLFLILISFYLIAISLFLNAITYWYLRRTMDAFKQLVRALMLAFFITFIVFHL